MNDEEVLNYRDAYDAMLAFLARHYAETGHLKDQIRGLIGDMVIDEDGLPIEAAMWDDWLAAIAAVHAAGDARLERAWPPLEWTSSPPPQYSGGIVARLWRTVARVKP